MLYFWCMVPHAACHMRFVSPSTIGHSLMCAVALFVRAVFKPQQVIRQIEFSTYARTHTHTLTGTPTITMPGLKLYLFYIALIATTMPQPNRLSLWCLVNAICRFASFVSRYKITHDKN